MTKIARTLPPSLSMLAELALDLRWTWSHAGDALWRRLHAEPWERSGNPWLMLQLLSRGRERERMLQDPTWFGSSRS